MKRTIAKEPGVSENVGSGPVSNSNTADDDQQRTAELVRDRVDEAANAAALEVWKDYARSLPEDIGDWRIGAAYVCDRHALGSGDAPAAQLAAVLGRMASEGVYVPRENVHYDVVSRGSQEVRTFDGLLSRARDGEFVALGAYSLDRLCRTLHEVIVIKRKLRTYGVELVLVGDPADAPWTQQTAELMSIYDEFRSRQTSYEVGMTLERLASTGIPQGLLPEGFIVDRRAPSIGGRRGQPTHWVFNEPLAEAIKEGAQRYLDGASFADLAEWSLGSILKGRTPKGRAMTSAWWSRTLANPKYAGLQMAYVYMGYKPGRESMKRPIRNDRSQLIESRLPALISAGVYRQIVEVGRSRRNGHTSADKTEA